MTPFSQYTKNIALMNLLTMEQGKGRYVMMDDAIWGMILGKSGKVPGTIAPELVELAEKKGLKFTDADPHTLLENALDGFRKEMDENGWDYGQDDEELYEQVVDGQFGLAFLHAGLVDDLVDTAKVGHHAAHHAARQTATQQET